MWQQISISVLKLNSISLLLGEGFLHNNAELKMVGHTPAQVTLEKVKKNGHKPQ